MKSIAGGFWWFVWMLEYQLKGVILPLKKKPSLYFLWVVLWTTTLNLGLNDFNWPLFSEAAPVHEEPPQPKKEEKVGLWGYIKKNWFGMKNWNR